MVQKMAGRAKVQVNFPPAGHAEPRSDNGSKRADARQLV